MKRLLVLMLLCCLALSGCGGEAPPIEASLVGVWVSEDAGALDMVETITLTEEGSLTVSCTFQGCPAGTLTGTAQSDGRSLVCHIQQGATPYTITYSYRIDGRRLTLSEGGHDAHYLKTS